MTRYRRRAFLKGSGAAGAVALTGLAGCSTESGDGGDGGDGSGGSGGDGGDGGDGGSTSSGGSGPYTIAATIPQTGHFSTVGQDVLHGYELGVQRMNDDGVMGGNVELVHSDDESNPEKVQSEMTQLLSNNDVDMLWGSFSSVLNPVIAQIAEREGIPFLAIAASYEQPHYDNEFEWVFKPFPQSTHHAKGTLNALQQIPEGDRPTNLGQWVPNTGWSTEMADRWEETLTGAGMESVFRETYQFGATDDFSTLISQSESAGVEILLSTPAPPGGITMTKQMKDAGFAPSFVQLTRAADTVSWTSALGADGEYVVMSPGWVPGMTGNGNADMVSAYHESYDVEEGSLLPVMVGAAYNLTQTAEQAIEAAGTAEKAGVRDALRSGTFETVSGTIEFNEVGLPTEDFVPPMGQWLEGNQHLIAPETDGDAYREMVYPFPAWGER